MEERAAAASSSRREAWPKAARPERGILGEGSGLLVAAALETPSCQPRWSCPVPSCHRGQLSTVTQRRQSAECGRNKGGPIEAAAGAGDPAASPGVGRGCLLHDLSRIKADQPTP